MKVLKNESGIALAIVLVLSAIALAIMLGLMLIITSGTQTSGIQKRYKTAVDAGGGAGDITFKLIALRGVATDTNDFLADLATAGINPVVNVPAACTGTNIDGDVFTGLAAKLNTPATSWSSCGSLNSVTINPSSALTYDMTFDLGVAPTYRIYTKIVDTIEGNSGPDTEFLVKNGVVTVGGGELPVVSRPYLYTIEVDSQNTVDPAERAKLSILYQY